MRTVNINNPMADYKPGDYIRLNDGTREGQWMVVLHADGETRLLYGLARQRAGLGRGRLELRAEVPYGSVVEGRR